MKKQAARYFAVALSVGTIAASVGVTLAIANDAPPPGPPMAKSPCSEVIEHLEEGDTDTAKATLADQGIRDVSVPRAVSSKHQISSINCSTWWPTTDTAKIQSIFFTIMDQEGEFVGSWAYVSENADDSHRAHLKNRLQGLHDVESDVAAVNRDEFVAIYDGDADSYARDGQANDESEMSVLVAFVEDQN
jgi:hypothetical protein